jgi:hypothetical protein
VNLALRGGRGTFLLEKWYADVLLDDGSVLIVYLAWMRVLGVPVARASAELHAVGRPPVIGHATARDVKGSDGALAFGPARIEGRTLAWETDGLSGTLRYEPRHPSVTLREPFLESGARRLLWTVEVPDADVSGELRWPGGGLAILGRGYRDRVFFDIPPWRFPIRELRWGRAVAGPHACIWNTAVTADGTITARWQDGRIVAAEDALPELTDTRVIVSTAVADIEGLRLGWLRPLLRRLTRDPREMKSASAVRLEGEPGRAVHEVVRWG